MRDFAWLLLCFSAFFAGRAMRGEPPVVQRPLLRCGPETVQYTDTIHLRPGTLLFDTFTVRMHLCHPIP